MQLRVLNYRHFWTAGAVLTIALFAITVAMASTWSNTSFLGQPVQWKSFYVNYYGYGDYTFVVKMPVVGYTGDEDSYMNYVAAPGNYSIKGVGTITIQSGLFGKVQDILDYNTQGTAFGQRYVAAVSTTYTTWLEVQANGKSDFYAKAHHIFLQSSSQLICPNETYNAPTSYSTLYDSLVVGVSNYTPGSEVDVFFCPEGGLPQYAEAQFWHGIK